ncbi:flagellar biosynthetic protein FliQ [Buchnera aphidicola]|uniref:flagellar biosynthetic protein FliQ n=1 Tax=Buchnera aphidicola TaxID=9 RepID=UPI0030EE32A1
MDIEPVSILFFNSSKIFLILSSPLLLSILFIGLIISIFQTVTQINEQNLSFFPKIISLIFILFFLGSWMIQILVNYMQDILTNIIILGLN